MADDSRIIDGNKNDDEDLMLELSIGGIFGTQKKRNWNSKELNLNDHHIKVECMNDIRQDSKRKREEAFNFGPFDENKEWLKTQIVVPQNGDVLDIGHVTKKEKINWNNLVYKTCQGNVNMNTNGSGGCSDGQCSCHQGNPTDYCRSISSNSQLDQQLPSSTSTTSDLLDPSDQPTGSSTQTVLTNRLTNSTLSVASPLKLNDQSKSHPSSFSNPPSKNNTSSQSLVARMPGVSTTGNGPNGRKISGFLYRYTKSEATIVCICHGQSFSPAGFVEHAGGVDVVQPLKHITIFPTAFAS